MVLLVQVRMYVYVRTYIVKYVYIVYTYTYIHIYHGVSCSIVRMHVRTLCLAMYIHTYIIILYILLCWEDQRQKCAIHAYVCNFHKVVAMENICIIYRCGIPKDGYT